MRKLIPERLTFVKGSKPGLWLRFLDFLPAACKVQGPSLGGRWGLCLAPKTAAVETELWQSGQRMGRRCFLEGDERDKTPSLLSNLRLQGQKDKPPSSGAGGG